MKWTRFQLCSIFIYFLLLQKGKNIKVLHLKTFKSVALPIFNSPVSNLDELEKQPSGHRKDGQVKTANLFCRATCHKMKVFELLAKWQSAEIRVFSYTFIWSHYVF